MGIRPRVTVVGSLNMDISVTVPSLPGPGVTVLGSSAARFSPGGKGANQAVAAARLGADVTMVGCVGDDAFGQQLLANLRAEHVNTDHVRVIPGTPTGLAMIAVDHAGENLIIVAPGANHEVTPADVATAQAAAPTDVVVISAEIPIPAITAALNSAPGALRILNLAPVPTDPTAIIKAQPDWLVVNESEAAALLAQAPEPQAPEPQAPEPQAPEPQAPATPSPEAQAAALVARAAARHAVVTAGAHGAALAAPDGTTTIEGFKVKAVDTVGAGDTFVGALAVALAAQVPPPEAVRAAAAAGAAAVTRVGAQTAMPKPNDILTITGLNWPISETSSYTRDT